MKHLLLSIASLLLILSLLHSQDGWRRLTTDDGLSDNKILTVYQAENGDIWIGTAKGINRYNGVFEEGPLLGSVNRILESPTGQIISRELLSRANRRPVIINLFDGLEWDEPDFFDDSDTKASAMPEFAVISDGKFWIATWNGLVGFDGQNWQFYDPDIVVDWLVKTPDGRLWSESWKKTVLLALTAKNGIWSLM